MKPSELLIKAKAVIADPKHWTQGWYAHNADGFDVESCNPEAVCWCSVGAIDKVVHEEGVSDTRFKATLYLAEMAGEFGCSSIPDLNDHSSHETVMKAWDRAIKLAKEDENR